MTSLLDDYSGGGILGVDALKSSGNNARLPQSRKEKIQAELKLLEWHKMANAAAIKSALLQTKSLKDQASSQQVTIKPQYTEEDEKWIKKVIQQEHIKPLEVSKDFVLEYEKREKENQDRLSHQIDKHIGTLKSLRQKLEARHELKTKTEEYRTWQRDFLPKKHAVMIGKTLNEIDTSASSPTTRELDALDKEINDELMNKKLQARSSQELNTVLDSLSRLADLEHRISSLEKDNKYDQMVAMEKPTANQRTAFEFRKKRGPMATSSANHDPEVGGHGPMGMVFEVRNKKPAQAGNSWKVKLPSGTGTAAVKAKHAQPQQAYDTDDYGEDEDGSVGGAGVFITAQSSTERLRSDREAQRRERVRNQALAPAGVKNLKQRVNDRKGRQKEQMIGQKRHEDAMREMAKRKAEQLQKKTGINAAARNTKRTTAPARGAAAGVKTNNKYMQEFNKMKNANNKRKEDFNRGGGAPSTRKSTQGGIDNRFNSQTAPAYSSKINQNLTAAAARSGRIPKAAPAPMTRRTNQMPTKRPNALDAHNKTAPAAPHIAVTGMGGLRAIKAGLHNNKGR